MTLAQNIARQFREVYFGGNWTTSNVKDNLADVTWQQATTKVHSFNTIAVLTYHIHYYVRILVKVLENQPLQGSDKESFDAPAISSEEEWRQMVTQNLAEGEKLASLIGQLPDDKMWELFFNEKYGNYYRNFCGVIEHIHYHLGQIALIKKLV